MFTPGYIADILLKLALNNQSINQSANKWFGWLVLWCLTPLSTIFQLYHLDTVLLVEETLVPRENHRPVANH